jgi:anti-sigma regulatory factor (Ser/Thr protein kinase)
MPDLRPGELRLFQARMDCVPLATAFVEAFCDLQGIDRGDALRLTLIVEELLTNTVQHGHGGDSEAAVHIELAADGMFLTLRYEDHAPPFDPLQHLAGARPEWDAAAADRRVGGLGLHLMAQMAHSLDYRFVGGRNRLHLVLRREG